MLYTNPLTQRPASRWERAVLLEAITLDEVQRYGLDNARDKYSLAGQFSLFEGADVTVEQEDEDGKIYRVRYLDLPGEHRYLLNLDGGLRRLAEPSSS